MKYLMGKIGTINVKKSVSHALLITMLFSVLILASFVNVSAATSPEESTEKAPIPKPSVPRFTVEFDNESRTIRLEIKNQPFDSYYDTDIRFYYNIRFGKSGDWTDIYRASAGYLPPDPESEYTVKSYFLTIPMDGKIISIPYGEVSFQVEAMIGSVNRQVTGSMAPWVFSGEKSGWSEAQTVTIPPPYVPPPPPPTSMHVSLESSTSYVGFKVAIEGNLTSDGEGVSGAPVFLSYSVTGGDSWNDITQVCATDEGKFSAIWLPSATGNYLVKASWAGNSTLLESNSVVSLSVIEAEEEKVFAVTSNSTVTQLFFNSTDRVLAFSVNGPSGTSGYAKISIAKTMLENKDQLEVHLDGNMMGFTSQETENAFQVILTYDHSTHKVVVTLGSFPSNSPQLTTPLALVLSATLLVIVAVLSVWRIRKGRRSPPL